MSERFMRGEPRADVVRFCGRNEVNPALSFADASDPERFQELLAARFGPGDPAEDAAFVYPIRDLATDACFEAYVSSDGPSYGGGADCYEDVEAGNLELKTNVIEALRDFDAWLESS